MRRLLCIGIGPGGPDQLTLEAVDALNRVDVFFVMDKGPAAADLTALRLDLCARHITHTRYRVVELPDPARDRTAEAYAEAVEDWTERRAEAYERFLRTEVPDGGTAGYLVWGDPAFYDSTLRVLEAVRARATVDLAVEVVPGVSAIAALAAAHRVSLTRVGRPVLVTTGRRLAAGFPDGTDDVVVMLDGDCTFLSIEPEGVDVYWGAYLGTPDQLLVAGPLAEVGERIAETRRRARAEKGWIMDTYLLRRAPAGDGEHR